MTPAIATVQDQREADRFLTLLDETAETFCFRVFDDNEDRKDPRLAGKFEGSLHTCWPRLVAAQQAGCGVYVVVNAGQQTNDTIYRVRAVFADFDGAALPGQFDLEPHIIVQSSPGKWHVYWLVDGLTVESFKDIQRNIAARYGSDKTVNDLARVMRLPGMFHQKGDRFLAHVIHESGELPYSGEAIMQAFGTPPENASAPAPTLGQNVEENRHADILKLTLMLAHSVRSGAMTRAEALDLMRQRRDSGRWSRHVPDDEILRALDGALQKGGAVVLAEPEEPARDLTTSLLAACVPFTEEERAQAAVPHPHAFMSADGRSGLFPLGEVTVLAAPGREGKTTAVATITTHYGLGWPLAGMAPESIGSVMIYSAEDDRAQYCRKLEAQVAKMAPADAARLNANVLVPELHGAMLAAYREIVRLEQRNPVRGPIVEHLIDVIRQLKDRECPLGLVIFETASTLSDAEEDNVGLRILVASLKHIAKMTGVAVVLTHHTSQESATKLPTLELSESAFRGGTALVNNARQTLLAVNLGSNADPFPDSDARTLLRRMAVPGESSRVTMIACLTSSKSAEPAPMFMRWEDSDPYGPRTVEMRPASPVAGKSWRGVFKLLSGARVEAREEQKVEKEQANVRLVVRAACELAEAGDHPTVAKVSAKCGRNPGWAKPYLANAVALDYLIRSTESVPRTRGVTDVYRPPSKDRPWESGDSLVNPSAPWAVSKESEESDAQSIT